MNNILEYLEENINIKNSDSFAQLQVWNNAAFDGEDLTMKTSWSSSDCTKENLSPTALNISSSTSSKPSSKHAKFKNQRNIDEEITEIESEIGRLTSRLETLRLEKSDRKIASEKRIGGGGRVVAAKFMEPKRNAVPCGGYAMAGSCFADDLVSDFVAGAPYETPLSKGEIFLYRFA